jgi:hypothetical protein
MGKRLEQYYAYAKEKGGVQAQMRLAMKTGMSSAQAAGAPDDSSALAKAQEVLKEVLGDPNIPSY